MEKKKDLRAVETFFCPGCDNEFDITYRQPTDRFCVECRLGGTKCIAPRDVFYRMKPTSPVNYDRINSHMSGDDEWKAEGKKARELAQRESDKLREELFRSAKLTLAEYEALVALTYADRSHAKDSTATANARYKSAERARVKLANAALEFIAPSHRDKRYLTNFDRKSKGGGWRSNWDTIEENVSGEVRVSRQHRDASASERSRTPVDGVSIEIVRYATENRICPRCGAGSLRFDPDTNVVTDCLRCKWIAILPDRLAIKSKIPSEKILSTKKR